MQNYFFCLIPKPENGKNNIEKTYYTIRSQKNEFYINNVNINTQNSIKKLTPVDKELLATALRYKYKLKQNQITKEIFLKILHQFYKEGFDDVSLRNRFNNSTSRINTILSKNINFAQLFLIQNNSSKEFNLFESAGKGEKNINRCFDAIEIRKDDNYDKDIKVLKSKVPHDEFERIYREIEEFNKETVENLNSLNNTSLKNLTSDKTIFYQKLAGQYYTLEISYRDGSLLEKIPTHIEPSGYFTRKSPDGSLYKGQITIANTTIYIKLFSEGIEQVSIIYDISSIEFKEIIEDYHILSGIVVGLTHRNEPIARASLLMRVPQELELNSQIKHIPYNGIQNIIISKQKDDEIRMKLKSISQGNILRVTS